MQETPRSGNLRRVTLILFFTPVPEVRAQNLPTCSATTKENFPVLRPVSMFRRHTRSISSCVSTVKVLEKEESARDKVSRARRSCEADR